MKTRMRTPGVIDPAGGKYLDTVSGTEEDAWDFLRRTYAPRLPQFQAIAESAGFSGVLRLGVKRAPFSDASGGDWQLWLFMEDD